MRLFKRRRPESDDLDTDTIDGERTIASVNRGLRTQAKLTNYLMLATILALTGFLLYKYYAAVYANHKAAQADTRRDASRAIETGLPPLKPVILPAKPPEPQPVAAASVAPPAGASNQAQPQQPMTPAQVAQNRRLNSGVMFKNAGATAGGSTPAAGISGASDEQGRAEAATGNDAFARSFQPSRLAAARAYMLAHPSMTVTKATAIPCSVIPAMDTTLPGIVSCMQKADVWSADGNVLLLERGTKWVGEQKSGLAQGQQRVGVLWTRGETPNHVLVDVDSGTADSLGRAGIPGTVDTHFWDRFGGAILVSLIGDVGSYLAATQQRGNNNTSIAFPGTVTGAQSAMSDILKATINIPPTLTTYQGADIVIYVARDLDFSDVYRLEARP
jgi:type IV secretion system protein VirB10